MDGIYSSGKVPFRFRSMLFPSLCAGIAVAVLGIFTPALERSYQVLHGHSSDLTPSAGPPYPPGSINISYSGQIVKHFFSKKFFIFTKKGLTFAGSSAII